MDMQSIGIAIPRSPILGGPARFLPLKHSSTSIENTAQYGVIERLILKNLQDYKNHTINISKWMSYYNFPIQIFQLCWFFLNKLTWWDSKEWLAPPSHLGRSCRVMASGQGQRASHRVASDSTETGLQLWPLHHLSNWELPQNVQRTWGKFLSWFYPRWEPHGYTFVAWKCSHLDLETRKHVLQAMDKWMCKGRGRFDHF